MAVINVYGVSDIDYDKNGAAILAPMTSEVREQAGGMYELTLTHPVDRMGIWSLLLPGNILKCSVPAQAIESAISGENVDIYRVTVSAGANVYAKPSAPQRITYTAWDANSIITQHDTYYPTMPYVSEGVKVTYTPTGQNYQAIVNIMNESAARAAPPDNSAAWKEIGNYTKGSAELAKLPQNEEFYLISVYSSSWLYIQTKKGIQGYIEAAKVQYVRTETTEEMSARQVATQLFRIYEVQADSARKTVSVKARHVSYDLAGNLVTNCAVKSVEAAVALSRLRNSLLFSEECTLATNLTEEDGLFTGDFSWKNPINALLDPDTGIVANLKGKLIRDNWDIFVNKNTSVDRGLRLSYGRNLTGVSWKRDTSNLINRVVPVAQKANGTELTLDEMWVDSPILDSYPVIRTEYLNVNEKVGGEDPDGNAWTEETLKDYMRQKAAERFSVDNVDKPLVELEVQFVLLGDSDEYRQYRKLERLSLYDTVLVEDPTLNLSLSLQVSEYRWDPVRERFTGIKLGSVFEQRGRIINGYNLVDGSIRYNKLSPDTIAAIKEAIS